MAVDDQRNVVRQLAQQADQVGRLSGREPWREALQWISRGRLGRRRSRPVVRQLDTPWQDTVSGERPSWRHRAANFDGEFAFSVDYQICHRCSLGWVEQPFTWPQYERCGLASAGLAALRAEHPRLAWHTLGGHLRESRLFWATVGAGVSGDAYEQRPLCPHVSRE